MNYVHTNEQLADFLTKVVSKGKLSYALSKREWQVSTHQLEGEC